MKEGFIMNKVSFYFIVEQLENAIVNEVKISGNGFNKLQGFNKAFKETVKQEFNVYFHISQTFKTLSMLFSNLITKYSFEYVRDKSLISIRTIPAYYQYIYFDSLTEILLSSNSKDCKSLLMSVMRVTCENFYNDYMKLVNTYTGKM